MKKLIKNAYDNINISQQTKERILDNIMNEQNLQPTKVTHIRHNRKKLLRTMIIAATVTAIIVFSTTALAHTQYNLFDFLYGNKSSDGANTDVDSNISSAIPETNSYISLQGAITTPEHLACVEWNEYLESYDPDGTILDKVVADFKKHPDFGKKEGLTYEGVTYNKQYYYQCYTQEMCKKLDEICEKYSLKLSNKLYIYYSETSYFPDETEISTKNFHKTAETKQFIKPSNDNFSTNIDRGYIYDNGTFLLEGCVNLKTNDATWKNDINFQFIRNVKGVLTTTSLNIGDADSYEQWNYITSNGVNLLLIRSEKEFKECIIANLNESYVVINITDRPSDDPEEKQKSKHDLELFAECFDFTAIP